MMKTDFHLVVDSDMKQIFQVAADGISYSKLNIPGLNVPVQTEYDPDTGKVSACFWQSCFKFTQDYVTVYSFLNYLIFTLVLSLKSFRDPFTREARSFIPTNPKMFRIFKN